MGRSQDREYRTRRLADTVGLRDHIHLRFPSATRAGPSLVKTSTGARKIVQWIAGTHPATDNDPTWLLSMTDVNAKNGTFTVDGVTYTAPTNSGHWFWSVLNEGDSRFTGSEYGNDLNRDGNPAGSSRLFGVIRGR